MEDKLGTVLILILAFSAGAIYHFRIRIKCIYPVKLTKPRAVLLGIIPIVFIGMSYYLAENSWDSYLLAISGSIFMVSGILGEGISKKGIYYRPLGAGSQIMRLAKWEDIKDIKLNINKNKLESFKYKSKLKALTIFPDQYYNSKDIDKIDKYIKTQQAKEHEL
ncbi:MAG: hypothetical protein ACTHW2_04765 [Tissierella sp.]|uniref:hypothetical protein n=1 Tax=Tissierella sp. TaxID=41274 RepID=UPI003F9E946E